MNKYSNPVRNVRLSFHSTAETKNSKFSFFNTKDFFEHVNHKSRRSQSFLKLTYFVQPYINIYILYIISLFCQQIVIDTVRLPKIRKLFAKRYSAKWHQSRIVTKKPFSEYVLTSKRKLHLQKSYHQNFSRYNQIFIYIVEQGSLSRS